MRILRQQFISKKPSQQKNLIIKSTVIMSIFQCIQASIINDDDRFERLKGSTFPTSTIYSSSMFSSTNSLESSSLQLSSRQLIHSALTSSTTTFTYSATLSEGKKTTITGVSAKKRSHISTFSSIGPLSKGITTPEKLLSKSAISSIPVSTNVTLHVTVTTGPKLIINSFSSSRLSSSVTLPTEITTASLSSSILSLNVTLLTELTTDSFSSTRLSSFLTIPTEITTDSFLSSRLSSSVTLSTEITTASFSSSRLSSSVTLPTQFTTASLSSSRLSSNVTLLSELNTASISSSRLSSTVALSTESTTASFLSSRFSSNVTLPTQFITDSDTSTLPLSGISTNKSTHIFQKTTIDTDELYLNTSLDSFSTVTVSSLLNLSDTTLSSEIKEELSTSTNIFKNKTVSSGSLVSDLSRTTVSSTKFITKLLQSSQFWTTRRPPFSDKLSTQQRSSLSNKPNTSVTQSTGIVFIPTLVTIGRTTQIASDPAVSSMGSTSKRQKKRDSSTAISESSSSITTLPTKVTFFTEAVTASSTSISVSRTRWNITDSNMSSLQPEKNTNPYVAPSTLFYETTTSKLNDKNSTTESGRRTDVSTFASQRSESTSSDPGLLSTHFVTLSTEVVKKDAKTTQPFSETVLNYSLFYSTSVRPNQITTDRTLSSAELTSKRPTKLDYSTESISITTGLPTQVPYSTKAAFTSIALISVDSTSLNTSLPNTHKTDAEISSTPPESSTGPFVLSTTFSNKITTTELNEKHSTTQSGTSIDFKSTSLRQMFETTSTDSALPSTKVTDYVASSFIPDTSPIGFGTSPTVKVKSEIPSLHPYSETISNYSPLYSSTIRHGQITSEKAVSSKSMRPTKGIVFTRFTESVSIVSVLHSKITFSTKTAFPSSTSISVESTSSNVLPVTNKTDAQTSSPLPKSSTSPLVASSTFSNETTTAELNETISRLTDSKPTYLTQMFDSTSPYSVFISTKVTEHIASSFILDTSPTDAVERDTTTIQPFSETILNYSPLYSSSSSLGQITSDKEVSFSKSTSKRPIKREFSTMFTESVSSITVLPSKVTFSTKLESASSTSIFDGRTNLYASTSLPFTNKTDSNTSFPLEERSTIQFSSPTTLSYETTTITLNETISSTEPGSQNNTKSTSLTNILEYSSTDSEFISTRPTKHITSSFIPDTSPIDFVTSPTNAVERDTTTIQPFSETISNYSPLYSSSSSLGQITSDKEVSFSESTSKRPTKREFSTTVTESVSSITALSTKVIFSTIKQSASSTTISVGRTRTYVSTSLPSKNITDSNTSTSSPLQEKSTTPFVASTTLSYETTTTLNETIPSTQSGTQIYTNFTSLTNLFEYSLTDTEFIATKRTDHVPSIIPTRLVTSYVETVENYTSTIQPFSKSVPFYSSSTSHGQIISNRATSSAEITSEKHTKQEFFTAFTESVSIITSLPTRDTFSSEAEFPTTTSISVEGTSSNVTASLPFTSVTDSSISYPLLGKSTTYFVESTTLSYEAKTTTTTISTELNETSSTTQSHIRTDTKSNIASQTFKYTSTDSFFVSTGVTDRFASSFIPDTNPTSFISSIGTVERDTTTIQLFSEAISNCSPLLFSSIKPDQITSDQAVSSAESTSKLPRTREISTKFTESFSIITALPTRVTFFSNTESASTTSISVGRTTSNALTYLPFTNITESNISSLPERSTLPFNASTTLSYETITKLNETFSSMESRTHIDTKSTSLTSRYESTSTDSVFLSTRQTEYIASSLTPNTSPIDFVTSPTEVVERDTTIQPFSGTVSNYSPLFLSSSSLGQITSDKEALFPESTSNRPSKRKFSTTFTESVSSVTALPINVTFFTRNETASLMSISVERTTLYASTSLPSTNITASNTSSSLQERITTPIFASTTLSYETRTTKLNETIPSTQSGTQINTKPTSSTKIFEYSSTDFKFISRKVTDNVSSSIIQDTRPTRLVTSSFKTVENYTTIQSFSQSIPSNSSFYSSSTSHGQITSDRAVSFAESTSKETTKHFFLTTVTEAVSAIKALPTRGTFSSEAGFSTTTSISVEGVSSNVTTSLPFTNVTDSNISYPLQEKSTTNFVASTTLSYETTGNKLNEKISTTQSHTRTSTKSNISSQKFESISTDFVFVSTRVTDHFAPSFIPDTNPTSFVTSSNYSPLFSSSVRPDQITSDQPVSSAESTSKRHRTREISPTFTESVSIITSLPNPELYSTKAGFISSTSLLVENTSSIVTKSLPVSIRTDAKFLSHLPERSTMHFVMSTKLSYETSTSSTELNKPVTTKKPGSRNDTLTTFLTQMFESISTDSVLLSTKVINQVASSGIPDANPTGFATSSTETVEKDTTAIQLFSETISNYSPLYVSSIRPGQITTDKAVPSAESTSIRPTKREFSTVCTDSISMITSMPTLETYSTKNRFSTSTLISIENTSLNVKTSLPVTSMSESHVSFPLSKRSTTSLVASTTTSNEKPTKHNETSFTPTMSYETSSITSNHSDTVSTTQTSTRTDIISNFASKSVKSSPVSSTYTGITTTPTITSTLTTLTIISTKASSPEAVGSETTFFQSSLQSVQIEANSSPLTFISSTLILSHTTQFASISENFVSSTLTAKLFASVSGNITDNNKTESSPSIQETTTIVQKTPSVRYNNTSNLSTTESSTFGKTAFESTLSRFLSTVISNNATDFVNSSTTTISRSTNEKASTSQETVFSTNNILSASTAPFTHAPNQIYSTVENTFNLLSSIKPSNDSTKSTIPSYDLTSLAMSFPKLTASTFIPKYSNFFMSISTQPDPTSNVATFITSDQLPGSGYMCNANENCCENRVHGHVVIIASVIQDHKATDPLTQPGTNAKPSTSMSTSTTTKTPTVPTQTKPTNKKDCQEKRLKGQLIVVASVNQKDSGND